MNPEDRTLRAMLTLLIGTGFFLTMCGITQAVFLYGLWHEWW